MNTVLLTKSDTFLIGWVAEILGYIMNAIFAFLDLIRIPNIGLSIILFTIVVNMLMLPLTMKQQKFSKLSARMNPEINAIRDKYKNKKDNDSVMAMNNETRAVYAKYGVSPSGSCVQLLIQMPILFALYQVIYKIPAYVTKVGNVFRVLAEKIVSTDNATFLTNPTGLDDNVTKSILNTVKMYGGQITKADGNITNGVIDVLNKLSTTDMNAISAHYGLADLRYNEELILSSEGATGLINTYNSFLGINTGNSPSFMMNEAIAAGAWLLAAAALIIPILSALTQWINTKLMPSVANDNKDGTSSMGSSMKMMNTIMPIMSAFFCFTLPAGMGLYWIAGSVIRSIQQIVINKYLDKKLNLDEIIEKNKVKSAKAAEKINQRQTKYNQYAAVNAKRLEAQKQQMKEKYKAENAGKPLPELKKKTEESKPQNTAVASSKTKSLLDRANMVRDYNERNTKK